MEHETGSGWTGSPAHVSDDANAGTEPGRGPAASIRADAQAASDPALSRAGVAAARDQVIPPTGEPRVDAALRLLERLPGLPVSEHPQLFEQVHAQLSEVLGELDTDPGELEARPGAAGR
jgi:hypothetical protein